MVPSLRIANLKPWTSVPRFWFWWETCYSPSVWVSIWQHLTFSFSFSLLFFLFLFSNCKTLLSIQLENRAAGNPVGSELCECVSVWVSIVSLTASDSVCPSVLESVKYSIFGISIPSSLTLRIASSILLVSLYVSSQCCFTDSSSCGTVCLHGSARCSGLAIAEIQKHPCLFFILSPSPFLYFLVSYRLTNPFSFYPSWDCCYQKRLFNSWK